MERLKYLDFELKFERHGAGFLVRILHSPGGEASDTFTLPFSEEKLENLILKLGRLRRRTRRVQSPEMEAAREFGGKLFEAVFSSDMRACFKSSLDETHRQPATGLRLKLRLQETPELADLPWEFLFDPSFDRFFAQSDYTPIVRYIELPERIDPLTITLPLHMLVMISSPTDHDYACLDVEREKANMLKSLEPLMNQRKVQVDWLEEATLKALQHRLREQEYHIFHFIGHGGFDIRTNEGVLVLKDERGNSWLAGAHRIGTALHDCRSLRLAVLNSCEGARNTRTDPFAGIAATLVRQGIPAVVAMQFEITDEAAITFSSEFYASLAEGLPVDASLAQARKAIYFQPNDVEWGTPVLYMRSPDGILFNLVQFITAELPPVDHISVSERVPPVESETEALMPEGKFMESGGEKATETVPEARDEGSAFRAASNDADATSSPAPYPPVKGPQSFWLSNWAKMGLLGVVLLIICVVTGLKICSVPKNSQNHVSPGPVITEPNNRSNTTARAEPRKGAVKVKKKKLAKPEKPPEKAPVATDTVTPSAQPEQPVGKWTIGIPTHLPHKTEQPASK